MYTKVDLKQKLKQKMLEPEMSRFVAHFTKVNNNTYAGLTFMMSVSNF